MKEYFKIAWRNLWRNRKRTLITVASVFFAVFLALLMRSMQLGSYDAMERNTIKNTTGYIQIHAPGYWDDKTINNIFSDDGISGEIEELPNVTLSVPRLESFALGSSGTQTKGIAVIGTDPEVENAASGLEKRIIQGEYLEKGDDGVLVVVNLAKFLKLGVGDTITLISQGYHGVTAAGIYPVKGIIEFPSTQMNNKLLYMDLSQAQYLYGAPDMLTSISIMLDKPDKLASDTTAIREMIGPDYEIMEWREMNPEVVQGIESDNISGMFMLGILYVVVGFGILGTMMMMTLERKREFGVMVSVGMQRHKLSLIVLVETLFIALIGVISGIIGALPLIYYFHLNPIKLTGEAAKAMLDMNVEPVMPFSTDLVIFYNQAIVVLVLTIIAVLYPLMVIHRFNVLKAIRGR
ncbi:MAG: ABC transporter permease [Bacteroidales bacterium]|jgi:ABC-type lipoprotein release transport system permease subunit|nr:ABC transporter permease [Bacteroidales bacterium]